MAARPAFGERSGRPRGAAAPPGLDAGRGARCRYPVPRAGPAARSAVTSIVIPVYNERESLLPLHAEIVAMAAQSRLDVEVVFVDDGSTDGSWPLVADLSKRHANVRGIRFRRNFGKAAALAAGFRAAKGAMVVTMDADLQDDPAEVPRFLAALESGGPDGASLDVVSGWKRVRRDPWHKVWPSRMFNGMVSWLTGVRLHDHNCGMKAYRADVAKEVRLYGELHRFVPVLAAARGFKVGEIEINHRPRKFGHSKYGVRRFVKGFLDLLTVKFLTGFGQRPQHFLGAVGLFSFLLGNAALLYLAVTWGVNFAYGALPEDERPFPPVHKRALLPYGIAALLAGLQMMSIGFLAEMIASQKAREEDAFSVAEQAPPTGDDHDSAKL
ncbi:MAG: glycosyltransferase family 2 protein [Gemmataceae bacterium]|nr:glycosyltransferase family 2 protein [Gemmataceae bacterium]